MTAVSTSASRSANVAPGSASGSDGHVLTRGFYQLTLVATFLTTAEIQLRALPGLPGVSMLELVVAPVLLCVIAELLYRPVLRTRARALYRRNRAVVWYAGYAAVASLAGLTRTTDTLKSCHDLFIALALYTLVGLVIDDRARMTRLLAAALAGAMVNVGLAMLQIVFGGPYPVPMSANIESKLDIAGEVATTVPTGLFNHPNALAVCLLPVVLFLLAATGAGLRTSPRRGLVMAALLAPTLLVFEKTYAKGAYAWLGVGGCFLVLPRRFDRHRAWLAMVVSIAGIVALTWFSIDAFIEGDLAFGTIVSRIELWLATVDIVRSDSFVTVFGSGGSQLARHTVTFEYPNAHNAWLDQALTYGVPALALYLAAYLASFRSLARWIRSAPAGSRYVALATCASLVAILGESFFEPTNHGILFQAQLLLMFAIAASPAWHPAQPAPRPESSTP